MSESKKETLELLYRGIISSKAICQGLLGKMFHNFVGSKQKKATVVFQPLSNANDAKVCWDKLNLLWSYLTSQFTKNPSPQQSHFSYVFHTHIDLKFRGKSRKNILLQRAIEGAILILEGRHVFGRANLDRELSSLVNKFNMSAEEVVITGDDQRNVQTK